MITGVKLNLIHPPPGAIKRLQSRQIAPRIHRGLLQGFAAPLGPNLRKVISSRPGCCCMLLQRQILGPKIHCPWWFWLVKNLM
jgi:hypothetical protein